MNSRPTHHSYGGSPTVSTTRLSRWILPTLTVLVLTGCGSTTPSSDSSASSPTAATDTGANAAIRVLTDQDRADCAAVFAGTPPVDAPSVLVVPDLTASHSGQIDGSINLPQELAAELTQVSLAGGSISIVAVNGPGGQPLVLARNAALSTTGPRDAPSVQRVAAAMPSCVADLITRKATPTVGGTDLYSAIGLISEMVTPTTSMWWLTDMEGNAGQLDLSQGGLLSGDAAAAAAALAGQAPLDLHGVPLHVDGIGNTVTGVTTHGRQWLADFTKALCSTWQATGCDAIRLQIPVAGASNAPSAPEDPDLAFPAVVVSEQAATGTTPVSCSFSVPSALTFKPDSAELLPDAADALQDARQLLIDNPDATAEIVGHTASTPETDLGAADRALTLSQQRADATRQLLIDNSGGAISPDHITTVGVGDTQPIGEDIDPITGQQIAAAAALERRVDVTVHGVACR